MIEAETSACLGCLSCLVEPYIRCVECGPPPFDICLHCFAKGFEANSHESNHQYEVVKNDFPIVDPKWTAAEEIKLLKAIADCGIGNWANVARQVQTKNKGECEKHFIQNYVDNPKQPLPELKQVPISVHPAPVVFKLCEDPPRVPESSILQVDMSGYQAARSEFFAEYDNFAEMDIAQIDFEDDEEQIIEDFEKELKFAVIDIYRNCVRERYRKKRIIRDYGLISIKKLQLEQNRHERILGESAPRLRAFCRLLSPMDMDKYMECLYYENELRNSIRSLQEYRRNGITNMASGNLFHKLNMSRKELHGKNQCLSNILGNLQDETACQQWLHKHASSDGVSKGMAVVLPNVVRKAAGPLDIVNLPSFEKLNSKEKEMCSNVRVIPQSYLDFKRILISECSKNGYLRLAQARTLIKIDVNKTRKIYDFLLTEGYINKEAPL